MLNKEEYLKHLKEMVDEDEGLKQGNYNEILYRIDGMNVYGDYQMGRRGVDHNILLFDGVDRTDLFKWGTMVVPEGLAYISNTSIKYFEDLGYKRMDLE